MVVLTELKAHLPFSACPSLCLDYFNLLLLVISLQVTGCPES